MSKKSSAGNPGSPLRRRMLRWLLALPGAGFVAGHASAALLTPAQAEGPFYPTRKMRFADVDNDLVRITGQVREAGGEIVRLTGRVLTADGVPVAGARVEIWQCDVNGRYLHSLDRNRAARDAAFQGFGHDITDADGRYLFRTIRPVAYPGRTPHIHVKVLAGAEELTTQFYVKGEPGNSRDGLYRRLDRDERRAVEMVFSGDDDTPVAQVDIVI